MLDKKGITLDAGRGDVKVSGRNVDIQAKVGVTIGGRKVSVNGSADVTVDGGALAVLKGTFVHIN